MGNSLFQCRILLVTTWALFVAAGAEPQAQDPKPPQVQAARVLLRASTLHPIDGLVFGTSSENLHLLIDHAISDKVYDLTSKYDLTDEQKTKLKLAAKIEAKHFFLEAEQLHRDYEAAADADRKKPIVLAAESLGKKRRKLFGADSFLAKVTAKTVSEEQRRKHELIVTEQIRLRHRSNIEGAIRDLERQVVLQISQHEALVDLLLNEIPPPKSLNDFDETLVKYQFSQLSEKSLRPVFRADQWPGVRVVFNGFEKLELVLKQQGLIADANDALSAIEGASK